MDTKCTLTTVTTHTLTLTLTPREAAAMVLAMQDSLKLDGIDKQTYENILRGETSQMGLDQLRWVLGGMPAAAVDKALLHNAPTVSDDAMPVVQTPAVELSPADKSWENLIMNLLDDQKKPHGAMYRYDIESELSHPKLKQPRDVISARVRETLNTLLQDRKLKWSIYNGYSMVSIHTPHIPKQESERVALLSYQYDQAYSRIVNYIIVSCSNAGAQVADTVKELCDPANFLRQLGCEGVFKKTNVYWYMLETALRRIPTYSERKYPKMSANVLKKVAELELLVAPEARAAQKEV